MRITSEYQCLRKRSRAENHGYSGVPWNELRFVSNYSYTPIRYVETCCQSNTFSCLGIIRFINNLLFFIGKKWLFQKLFLPTYIKFIKKWFQLVAISTTDFRFSVKPYDDVNIDVLFFSTTFWNWTPNNAVNPEFQKNKITNNHRAIKATKIVSHGQYSFQNK